MTTKENILEVLSNIPDIIEYAPVKLASGEISEYYVQIKRSYGEPGIFNMYADYIIRQLDLDLQNISCIISSGYGGVPLASVFSSHLEMRDIKFSMFRDDPKEHGKPSMFDGYPPEELSKKKYVVIVDDVFTTGRSIRKIIEALPKDLTIGKIFVICNRSGVERPEIDGIEVEYLFMVEELVEAMK